MSANNALKDEAFRLFMTMTETFEHRYSVPEIHRELENKFDIRIRESTVLKWINESNWRERWREIVLLKASQTENLKSQEPLQVTTQKIARSAAGKLAKMLNKNEVGDKELIKLLKMGMDSEEENVSTHLTHLEKTLDEKLKAAG